MQLNFTEPVPYTHDGETVYHSHAIATLEFWAKWKYNKSSMMDAGLSITSVEGENGKILWRVMRVQKEYKDCFALVKAPMPVQLKDTSKLLDYQPPVVSALLGSLVSNKIALDGSDTGTGKTYVALKAVVEAGLQPCIICTKTGIRDWKDVCAYFNVSPVFIFNWESSIGRIYKKDHKIVKTCPPPNPYIEMKIHPFYGKPIYRWKISPRAKVCFIFDEAHKSNGNDTHAQGIVKAAMGYNILALSATLADKTVNLRNIGALTGLFKWDEFNEWLRKNGCFINDRGQFEPVSEREVLSKINKHIFPNYGVRVKKSEVPGFPDVQNIARLYDIKKAATQNKAYEKLKVQIEKLKGRKDTAGILVAQLRHRQMAEMYKVELLTDLAKEYIESGMSVVIFCNYVDTLERLRKALDTECLIQGGQKIDVRRKNIEDFQADRSRVLVSIIQAGGTGLSLHDLNGNHPRAAIICPTYDAKMLIQVMGRIHRAGAKTKAINLLAYSAGTIEEKVYSTVKIKIGNVNLLNDGDLADLQPFEEE